MLDISKHFLDSKQIYTANMLVAPIAPEFSTVDQRQHKWCISNGHIIMQNFDSQNIT